MMEHNKLFVSTGIRLDGIFSPRFECPTVGLYACMEDFCLSPHYARMKFRKRFDGESFVGKLYDLLGRSLPIMSSCNFISKQNMFLDCRPIISDMSFHLSLSLFSNLHASQNKMIRVCSGRRGGVNLHRIICKVVLFVRLFCAMRGIIESISCRGSTLRFPCLHYLHFSNL